MSEDWNIDFPLKKNRKELTFFETWNVCLVPFEKGTYNLLDFEKGS